jgi:hypothetical protein
VVAGRSEFSHVDRTLIVVGAVILGFTLQISDGLYDPVALIALGMVATCMAAALAGIGHLATGFVGERVVSGMLLVGLAANLVTLAVSNAGLFLDSPRPVDHPAAVAGLVAAGVLVALIAFDGRRSRAVWFPALLLVFLALGIWLIRASPDPRIDVMTVQRAALRALTHRASPYSITFPNIYDNADFYPPGSVVGGRVQFGLPYPPLSLLMALPGHVLFGDLRYAELGALVVGAGAIGYTACGRIAPLAAALLIFTPRSLYVLEQGWTESFAVCWLGLTVLTAVRRSDSRVLVFAGLLAVKQHLVLSLPLTACLANPPGDRRDTMRLAARAIGIAVAVTIPFVLWDPAGFWHSVVSLQFREPFRVDSLSVLSYLARRGWSISPAMQTVVPVAAASVGLAVAWWWSPRAPSGFAVGLGFVLLLVFAFGKKAFCNYYFFALALFAAGIAADSDVMETRGRQNQR